MSETKILGRLNHPAVTGVISGLFSGARFWLTCLIGALLAAAVAWIIAAAQSFPVSGIGVWALKGTAAGFGLPWGFGSLGITLPPTLFTLILAWLIFRTAARLRERTHGSAASFAGLVAALCLGVVLSAVFSATPFTPLGIVRALILTVALPALSFRLGFAALNRWLSDMLGSQSAEAVLSAGATVRRALIALVIAANLLIAAGVVMSILTGIDTLAGYSSPVFAAFGLGLIQALFAPTIVSGTLVWSTGLPVSLTAGADFSVLFGTAAPLPALPILGLVPMDPPGWAAALIAVPILAVTASVVGRRSWYAAANLHTLASAAVQLVLIGAVCALFSRGGIGPGGLADFGPHWYSTLAGFAVWAAGGFGLAYLLLYLSVNLVRPAGSVDSSAPADAGGTGEDS